jgi:hypothetical protein
LRFSLTSAQGNLAKSSHVNTLLNNISAAHVDLTVSDIKTMSANDIIEIIDRLMSGKYARSVDMMLGETKQHSK